MAPSTVQENSLPNVVVFTFAVVRAYSWRLAPSRVRSLCQVGTLGRVVTPMLTALVLLASVILVALITYTPAVAGAVNVTFVPVLLVAGLKEPPPGLTLQATPAVSLVVALNRTV